MDLFGKKRIAQLEEALAGQKRLFDIQQQGWKECERREEALTRQVEYLIRTIRKTDDIIFSISQCTDWPNMRPRIAQLTDEMTARKVAESNRINSLITSELHSTYRPDTEMGKQQAALPSPIDGKR